jgi:hypothetical protein
MQIPTRRLTASALFLLLVSLFLFVGWASAGVSAAVTPVAFAYLPAVYKQPTPTPTPTATATSAPAAITGELTLCNPGQTVYSVGSQICVVETLRNTFPYIVTYGILGVAVDGPSNYDWFQTSWSGQLAIGPGCTGPTDTCGGPWQDNIRGPYPENGFSASGAYTLKLAVCYSVESVCPQQGANWQVFEPGVAITISSSAQGTEAFQTNNADRPMSVNICHLFTADPTHIYLVCPSSEK